ncbi:BlaI/MecI/CopY family transcriptional regulator [Marinicella meishanensis]|uniref:BlaI/MecI/CopY family transcriptional regulator n=1 Tax=Marinicella meishanensis TaxID=2873263 RepID=UPI001CBCEB55|nr:BlaI/MecI/CopY family transcriptional regulator [Marinicella sp. NBU2979]
MTQTRPAIKLSQAQIEVMKVLWQHDKLSVSEVHQLLNQHKPLALTTVATMLKRLQEKGVIGYEKDGRQYLYQAQVSEAEVRSSMLGSLLQQLFDGEPEALVHHLVDQETVSEDDLLKIKALLDQEVRRD